MKKVIIMLFISCLVLGTSVLAVEPGENAAPQTQGEMPRQEQPGGMPGGGGMQPPQREEAMPEEMPAVQEEATIAEDTVTEDSQEGFPAPPELGEMPGERETMPQEESFFKTYSSSMISAVLLVLAFIFVKFYKRKQY